MRRLAATRGLFAILVVLLFWLALPIRADEAILTPAERFAQNVAQQEARAAAGNSYSIADLLRDHDVRGALAAAETERQQAIVRLHNDFWLHARGMQLYTAWGAPLTLKAINWYGFEYAPFVPDGLDKARLDDILSSLHQLGFNALRLTFANETVETNPVVTDGVTANPGLRGLRSLDIMERIIQRAHVYGLRVILCNSRSEAGRGPEIKSGLWYTDEYPETAWQNDWITLTKRFSHESAFVGADLRNEPHVIGRSFDINAYFIHGPLWGAFHGTYYHDRDWRYAAENMGNALLSINPHLLIIVEGVQMYLDPFKNTLTGGLWGSNLDGVQYDPIQLKVPDHLVYSVHEYGPHMWPGSWFNPHTSYRKLSRRWDSLWGYLLTASKTLQAPIFVGEFGTCHQYWACVSSNDGWKQGFWFKSFVRYLHEHPQVGWAYWALNPTGPFEETQTDYYSVVSLDWKHYYPLLTYGLSSLLKEPSGLWNQVPQTRRITPAPGCPPAGTCSVTSKVPASLPAVPTDPPIPPKPTGVQVKTDVPYIDPADAIHRGDLYLPLGQGDALRPAVVVIHGGDFDNGSKGTPETVHLARLLARHGYVVFDINYRLLHQGGSYPNNMLDVKDAVDYLANNADALHLAPKGLGLAGIGTGAYLALLAGYIPNGGSNAPPHYPGPQPRASVVASLFAPLDLSRITDPATLQIFTRYLGATLLAKPDLYTQASPTSYIKTGIPTYLVHGLDDKGIPFNTTYDLYQWLRQSSHRSQLTDFPGVARSMSALTSQDRHTVHIQLLRFFDSIFFKPITPDTTTN